MKGGGGGWNGVERGRRGGGEGEGRGLKRGGGKGKEDERKGAGKLRHINVSALWIQDIQDREGATYMKVLGTANPADLMTKYLPREKVDNAIDKMGQVVLECRANSTLDIQGKANLVQDILKVPCLGLSGFRRPCLRRIDAKSNSRSVHLLTRRLDPWGHAARKLGQLTHRL